MAGSIVNEKETVPENEAAFAEEVGEEGVVQKVGRGAEEEEEGVRLLRPSLRPVTGRQRSTSWIFPRLSPAPEQEEEPRRQ